MGTIPMVPDSTMGTHKYHAIKKRSSKKSPAKKLEYEKEEKRERDEQAVLSAKLEDAKAEGKAEGKAEVAKNLLRAGVDLDVIARTTQLSLDELKQLREEQ